MPSKQGRTKQARARKIGETVSYRVWIVGYTWEGFKSAYDYHFARIPTREEIERKAGDFQSVEDYQVYETRTIHYTDGERRIGKIVRDWTNPESSDFCCEAYGC